MTRLCLSLFFLMVLLPLQAQRVGWESMLHEVLGTEQMETTDAEELMEVLSELEANPIDLNSASREELEQIAFLSDEQIEEIQEYVYKYGGMRTLNELTLISSLDYLHRHLLSFFVCVREQESGGFPKVATIAKYGKHELLATGKIPFYERHGDKNGYLGYPYRHSLKYTFSYGDYVKAGFLGAQDAGEPFFSDKNGMGYDHYSFYVQLRKLGRLKSLVLGRYRMKMGMGLIMNTDVGLGKTIMLSSLGRSSNTLRGYSSRSSAHYLQGAAATVEIAKGLDLSAFVSYRKIDATLSRDGESVQTILEDGYHRTPTEMAKKNNTAQTAVGGSLTYRNNGYHVGLNGVYTSLDRNLKPIPDPDNPTPSQRYRLHRPVGDSFWNTSLDYGLLRPRFSINGEVAVSDNGAVATINNANWKVSSVLSLVAVQRYYSQKYTTLYGKSFSEGGEVQNENGFYLGAQWQASKHLTLTGYTDISHFPFERYQVASSSTAWDNLVSAVYAGKALTLSARYRLKMRQKNNDDRTKLIPERTHRGRLAISYQTDSWTLGSQADMVYHTYKENSFGWMLTESAAYRFRSILQGYVLLAYFHTDGNDARIYTYEKNLLSTFSFPSYAGEGIRYALMLRADITPRLMAIAKLGTTNYFDRDHISSGLQQIDHSHQTDLELQLRWKF